MNERKNPILGVDILSEDQQKADFSARMKKAHRLLYEQGVPNRATASEIDTNERNPVLGVDILSEEQQRADLVARMKEAHRRLDEAGIEN